MLALLLAPGLVRQLMQLLVRQLVPLLARQLVPRLAPGLVRRLMRRLAWRLARRWLADLQNSLCGSARRAPAPQLQRARRQGPQLQAHAPAQRQAQ